MSKTIISRKAKELLDRLDSRTAVIGVIGLGYVGLPLVLRFSEVGFKTIGFDVDPDKIRRLKRGQSYIEHIKADRIRAGLKTGMRVTADMSLVRKVDAVIMCVPTPLNKYREPDLSYVLTTVESVLPYLHAGQVVSLESTTYPGTTEEEIRPRIESRGFAVGRDIFVVFSPEREDPGNASYNTKTIPKVCGGSTRACLEVGVRLYGAIVDKVVPVSSTQTAEMTKLLENIHRAVNIGLVNEMKMIADRMNIDIHEVIRAAASKPFGFTPYSPGPGIGGHCIPIDPFYLTWKAREFGFNTRFIELSGDVNSRMPDWVVEKISQALNRRGKALSQSGILVAGIAYKKNVDDVRESPSIEIMEILRKLGARVSYSDPYVPVFPRMRHHRFDLKSVALTPAALRRFDCVVIATNHDAVDYDMIRKSAPLIVDTRAVYPRPTRNVVPA